MCERPPRRFAPSPPVPGGELFARTSVRGYSAVVILPLFLLLQVMSTEESLLYSRVGKATTPDAKIAVLQDWEKKNPKSPVIGTVYEMLMVEYGKKRDSNRVVQYGEKALEIDPENLQALTTVAHEYALQGQSLERAAAYAKRAKATVEKKKTAAPPGVSKGDWTAYLNRISASADGTLEYLRSIPRSLIQRKRPAA